MIKNLTITSKVTICHPGSVVCNTCRSSLYTWVATIEEQPSTFALKNELLNACIIGSPVFQCCKNAPGAYEKKAAPPKFSLARETKIATDYYEPQDPSGDPGAIVPRVSALPVSDQLQLTAAKVSLMGACAVRPLRLLASVPSAGCFRTAFCRAAREVPLDALRAQDVLPSFSDGDALERMAERFWGAPGVWDRFCRNCQDALQEVDEVEIRALWDSLPGVFALELDKDDWPGAGAAGVGMEE